MRLNYIFIFNIFISFGLLGQTAVCGFNEMFSTHGQEEDSSQTSIEEIKQILFEAENDRGSIRTDITIPVVVHIIYQNERQNITDENIFRQIEILNRDFNGENEDIRNVPEEFAPLVSTSGINFCLASTTPTGLPSSGIIRVKTEEERMGLSNSLYHTENGGSNAWNTEKYLNIWVADIGSSITGFGTYPGQTEANRQGVVIHPDFFGENSSQRYDLGRVTVHEVGHYFGLTHLWDNNSNCNTDDGILDTPMQSRSYSGCPIHPQVSCESNDLFMNFMDYTDDNCLVMFTKGQMKTMLNTIEILRPQLLENSNISCITDKNYVENISFSVHPNPTQSNIQISFKNEVSTIGDVKIYSITGQLLLDERRILTNALTLDLEMFASGLYLLQINETIIKLMKE